MAAARPVGAALNDDTARRELRFPRRQLVVADSERDVERSVAVMGRYCTARQTNGFPRGSTAKQQQHTVAPDVIGAEARIARQDGQFQHVLIEMPAALEVVDIEGCLDHPIEHGLHHMLSTSRASSDMRL